MTNQDDQNTAKNDMRAMWIGTAEIVLLQGWAWREANAGHASLGQLKVMSAIESCRTAALGGHVARCEDCAHIDIAYNSCLMGKICNGELAGVDVARMAH